MSPLMWLCGDGPALFGCGRCGHCLEHCKCRQDPVPVHILTRSAQEVIASKRREQRQREDPHRNAQLEESELEAELREDLDSGLRP